MAKTLILKDGSVVEMTDLGTIYNIQTVVENFATVDELALKITEENLANAEINEEKFQNIVPVNIKAESDANGNVIVTFVNRDKTVDELQNEAIGILQDTVLADEETVEEGGINDVRKS